MRRIAPFAVVFLSGVVLSAAVAGGVVWAANPQSFTDVPPSHPFYDEIEDVAGACVAGGYEDGTYRPGSAVTRQAMAAFLSRSMSRTRAGTKVGPDYPTIGSAVAATDSPLVDVASVSVTVPDLPGNCFVPVEVHASATVYTNSTQAVACHSTTACNVEVWLGQGSSSTVRQLARITTGSWGAPFSPTAVFQQADGTTVTYHLRVRGYNVKLNGALVDVHRQIVATTHPVQASP